MFVLIRSLTLFLVFAMPLWVGCGEEAPTQTSKSELQQYMEDHPELAVESVEVPDDLYENIEVEELEEEVE